MADHRMWPAGTIGAEDRLRFARYARFLEFADGQQWTERARRGEQRLVFNYARTLLRKTASYVFPAAVTFSVPPDSGDAAPVDAASAAERWLNGFTTSGGLTQLDLALATEIAILGDGVNKITWDAGKMQPQISAVDPATVSIAHAPDDPRRITRVTQVYGVEERDISTLFPQVPAASFAVEGNRVIPVSEQWTASTWEVAIAGQTVQRVANPYGWIPYVFAANNARPHECWGRSDLVDLEEVCREINRRLTIVSRVLELSGAPIAVLENVDGSEGINVGPGAKWELPEGARAYLLDLLQGGGTQLHIQYIDLLFRVLHDLSETPRTAFGDSGRDLSGAALEVEIQPLVQKVGRQRRMWDAFFGRRNAMLLDLMERFGGAGFGGHRQTVTLWPPVLPSDTETAVRNAVALVGSGIQSRYSAIAGLGEADPEAELARIAQDRIDTGATPGEKENAR
jgi:hypothetical protein